MNIKISLQDKEFWIADHKQTLFVKHSHGGTILTLKPVSKEVLPR
jgi:hypothetical protein